MMNKTRYGFVIQDKLTILVNTCDAYCDLWEPFFFLLKKYWNPQKYHIILNTETKDFQYEGLNIECVHSNPIWPYGKRIKKALLHVKTEYVLVLLDDFFIRTHVNEDRLCEIINWMENDTKIVYFNCDVNRLYANWDQDTYPGFRRIPPANDYTLNLQAAIWRTKKFKSYWLPNVTPWEWETKCNVLTYTRKNDKFYTCIEPKFMFLKYGHEQYGDIWGVYRGKWVLEDILPFFQNEGILIDSSKRSSYSMTNQDKVNDVSSNIQKIPNFKDIIKYMGVTALPGFALFKLFCIALRCINKRTNENYFEFMKYEIQYRFKKKHK